MDMHDKSIPVSKLINTRARKLYIAAVAFAALLLSLVCLAFSWANYYKRHTTEATKLAHTISALLPKGHIKSLEAKGKDTPEHAMLKQMLVRLVESLDSVQYAFLIGESDGEIYLLVDSNQKENPDFSPLNQVDNIEADLNKLKSNESMLTSPVSNAWGKWIRLFLPIIDPTNQERLAYLGVSYSFNEWEAALCKAMLPNILIALYSIVLLTALAWIWTKHLAFKSSSRTIALQEELYRNLFENAPIGIILTSYNKLENEFKDLNINPAASRIYGRDFDEFLKIGWKEITHPDDLKTEMIQFNRFLKEETNEYTIEKRIQKPDGTYIWVNTKVSSYIDKTEDGFIYLCLLEDISAHKEAIDALRESERSKSVLLKHLPGMAYRSRYDRDWTMEFVSEGSLALTGYAPESLVMNKELSYNDLVVEQYRELLWNKWTKCLEENKMFHLVYEIKTKSSGRKWVQEMGQGIFADDGSVAALEGIVFDITEQKESESRIAYLKDRDVLTETYNRAYLDNCTNQIFSAENWPISIAICDINGLKMINDTYGHSEGDRVIVEVATLLKAFCQEDYVLGRTGGGEFTVFMPHVSCEQVHKWKEDIQRAVYGFNQAKTRFIYDLSISIGHSTVDKTHQSIDTAFKIANEYLKHRKLLTQSSSHHSILSSIMATLYAKSQETEEHGKRLGVLTRLIGQRLGLGQKELDDLELLSMLHDLGKIGVDDSILNKPDKLSPFEWEQMKKHPEIGYRIAMSSPELEHIAKYILHHHERWDGAGYPSGLKGEEIPLPSRILAVADVFDAMTEDRIYQKTKLVAKALEEIEKCSGTQLDPYIAQVLLK